jgi:hypothetical protein
MPPRIRAPRCAARRRVDASSYCERCVGDPTDLSRTDTGSALAGSRQHRSAALNHVSRECWPRSAAWRGWAGATRRRFRRSGPVGAPGEVGAVRRAPATVVGAAGVAQLPPGIVNSWSAVDDWPGGISVPRDQLDPLPVPQSMVARSRYPVRDGLADDCSSDVTRHAGLHPRMCAQHAAVDTECTPGAEARLI